MEAENESRHYIADFIFNLSLTGLLFLAPVAFGGETASPDEIYDLILKAATVVEELGEEGLEAFKDPKGEFVYKDT